MGILPSDLTDGMSHAALNLGTIRVDGGEPLVRINGLELCGTGWCNFSASGLACSFTTMARNRKTVSAGGTNYYKDFVLHAGGALEQDHADPRRQSDPTSLANWYKNLYDVPMKAPVT